MAQPSGKTSSESLELENGDENGGKLDGTPSGGGDGVSDCDWSHQGSPVIVVDSPQPTDMFASDYSDMGAGGGDLEDIFSSNAGRRGVAIGQKNKGAAADREDGKHGRGAIKGGVAEGSGSAVPRAVERGCDAASVESNLAITDMERVDSEEFCCANGGSFGCADVAYTDRSRSPCYSSDNDWEASDHHSDTDADHSDSSDDDNPTSQVDRMIERGTRLIMDGENSALSSETDDTDDDDFSEDSESDITDVSPLVSNTASPLGLSPVMSRRNLLSTPVVRAPFLRHYSHKGHDGDIEDEGDEDRIRRKSWNHGEMYLQHDLVPHTHSGFDAKSPKMSFVVQELLKLTMESQNRKKKFSTDFTGGAAEVEDPMLLNGREGDLQQFSRSRSSRKDRRRSSGSEHKYKHQLSPSLSANPHHRHLRKGGRRKNMSFTNEEVRVINRDNSILLEKLLAVDGRDPTPASPARTVRPANATVNRKRAEDIIRKDNQALLRRLSEVRPSKSHHHHHHHNSHHSHHNSSSPVNQSLHGGSNNSHHRHHHHHRPHPRSCGATARHHTAATFSPPHHPKETAL